MQATDEYIFIRTIISVPCDASGEKYSRMNTDSDDISIS